MPDFTESSLRALAVHRVGNRAAGEGVHLSEELLDTDPAVLPLLLQFFTSPFRSEELFQLTHPSDLALNEVHHYATAVFDDPGSLLEHSQDLARHLHRFSDHPRVKSGEFYVALLRGCRIGDTVTDALGLFKSETRETYLKVYPRGRSFEVGSDDGININRLDKGCIIFNANREEGYLVAIVDNQTKGGEAQYWRDEFLQAAPCSDAFHQTRTVMEICRRFVAEKMPATDQGAGADRADLLNRTMKYMKENEDFSIGQFDAEVLASPPVISAFREYRQQVFDEEDIEISDHFGISGNAVKKQARFMKSVIKLDKNFHIYIHGDRKLVETGFDNERAMNFYKLYFREET